jgi:hypothetical protein
MLALLADSCSDFMTHMLQVGTGLLHHFNGQAAELVTAAGQSAVALVQLLTSHFPGLRDHSIYKGRQVRRSFGFR